MSAGSAVTRARIRHADPLSIADALSARYGEYDIETVCLGARERHLRYGDNKVLLREEDSALSVELHSPNEEMLVLIREGFARLLGSIDPKAVETMVWSGPPVEGSPPGFRELTLKGSRRLAPSLLRMTFATADLEPFGRDGLYVRLMVPAENGRKPVWPRVKPNGLIQGPEGDDRLHVRVYTIREVRLAESEIDIDVVMHEGGAFSDWAEKAAPATRIAMTGPGGGFVPPADDWLLIGGDLTALPAICRILELLPSSATGHALLTMPQGVREPLFRSCPEGMGIEMICETEASRHLVERMCNLAAPGGRSVYGWFGGEFEQAQAIRKHFKTQLNLGKTKQLSVAYWRQGEPQGGG